LNPSDTNGNLIVRGLVARSVASRLEWSGGRLVEGGGHEEVNAGAEFLFLRFAPFRCQQKTTLEGKVCGKWAYNRNNFPRMTVIMRAQR